MTTLPDYLPAQVIKKSCYPRWNESFEFELDDTLADSPLSVEVWDWDLVSKNDFLGKVNVWDRPVFLWLVFGN